MRLIDADATIKEIKARNPDDVSYEDAWAITCIEHAPTIEPERTWKMVEGRKIMNDLISKLSEIRSNYNCFDENEEPYYRALSEAIRLASAQPEEDCDTCIHGYFGDSQCDNCRVRYPIHYERRTDEPDDICE